MRLLRTDAYAMDPKKVHQLAMMATDDRDFADSLWSEIAHEKMKSTTGS